MMLFSYSIPQLEMPFMGQGGKSRAGIECVSASSLVVTYLSFSIRLLRLTFQVLEGRHQSQPLKTPE